MLTQWYISAMISDEVGRAIGLTRGAAQPRRQRNSAALLLQQAQVAITL